MKDAPDWGAYLAGALTPEETAEIDALLESDVAVRSQLQGYRSFASAVKQAGQSDRIPIERLESSLDSIADEAKQRRTPILAFAIAACLLIALVWAGYRAVSVDNMALAITPTEERIATDDPQAAMQWVHSKTPLDTPHIELADAELVGARYGEGWACYDYERNGEAFYLYMSTAKASVENGDEGTLNGTPVFRGKGIGWVSGNLAYYLKGGEAEAREQLASQALTATQN